MKTKKKTYLLLVLVIGVWSTIAYKIIVALNPDTPRIATQEFKANNNYRVALTIDSFSVSTVNRDPFLGTLLKKPTVKLRTKREKPLQWQPIEYLGNIKKDKTKQEIFVVSINKNQYLLKKGQTKDSITLVYGNNKSVTLRYKNRLKTFVIKKL